MCHTGGPRCIAEAGPAYNKAKKNFEEDRTEENAEAMNRAYQDVMLTPEFIERTREKGEHHKADVLQKKYDTMLDGAKKYEMYRKETASVIKNLEVEKREHEESIVGLNRKIDVLHAEKQGIQSDVDMGGLVQGGAGGFMSDEDVEHRGWEIDDKLSALAMLKEKQQKELGLVNARIATVKASQEDNLERRKNQQPVKYSHLMPEKFAGYYTDTEKKHFSDDKSGSTFTEAKNLNEVLSLAQQQRKNLDGDDREALMARGAAPSSFTPGKRYLMVKTAGKLGTVRAGDLDDNTVLTVTQKSAKVKPVCELAVDSQKDTDFATVVIADKPTLPGTEEHPSLLITAFPGASGPSGSNDDLLPYVGKTMTVADAREIYGRDFTVNTVLKKS